MQCLAAWWWRRLLGPGAWAGKCSLQTQAHVPLCTSLFTSSRRSSGGVACPWILPTGKRTSPSEARELGRLGREIARFYGTQESNCCFKRRYKPSGSRKMLWTMELDLCCCRVYLLFPGGQSVAAQVILLWGLLFLRSENYNSDGQFAATEQ